MIELIIILAVIVTAIVAIPVVVVLAFTVVGSVVLMVWRWTWRRFMGHRSAVVGAASLRAQTLMAKGDAWLYQQEERERQSYKAALESLATAKAEAAKAKERFEASQTRMVKA